MHSTTLFLNRLSGSFQLPQGKLLPAALLLSCNCLTSSLLYAGESTTLPPIKLTTAQGEASAQGVEALVTKDEQAGSDDWLDYVEFYPGTKALVSIIDFEAPINFTNKTLESLTVNAHYRGPAKNEQRWQWHIRNYSTDRWVNLGDNAKAADWEWTSLTYSVSGDATDYVNTLGRSQLRYSSPTSLDNSNLDSVSIELNLPDPAPIKAPTVDGNIWSPSPGTSWQWQLTGSIDTTLDVQMYDVDLFDAPQSVIDSLKTRNVAVICYFSAGSYENWRTDASAFPASVLGSNNGWVGEKWLDIRALDELAPVMLARLDLAVSKGCDGVEPDNVDGYANQSGFTLTAQDQLDFNIWLAQAAHDRGLSIGLKNDLDQVVQLEPWFDWALNEQCVQYDECEMLLPFVDAGKAVFGVEYSGNAGQVCSTTNALNLDWLIKTLDLGVPRQSCR